MQTFVRLTLVSLALTAASTISGSTREADLPSARADKDVNQNAADDAKAVELSPEQLCNTLVDAAQKHDLSVSFFSNLIWQESRFVLNAVSHAGALGIAQFMPKTAAAVGLDNPLDPLQALPASAGLLSNLFKRYGNLGLAAAAYNAGEARVNKWLSKHSVLPRETRDYVRTITGVPIERWKAATPGPQAFKVAAKMPCRDHEAVVAEKPEEPASAESSESKKASPSVQTASKTPAAKRHARKGGLKPHHGKPLGSVRTAARDKRSVKAALRQRAQARTANRRAGSRAG
jgi:hypothetical protein